MKKRKNEIAHASPAEDKQRDSDTKNKEKELIRRREQAREEELINKLMLSSPINNTSGEKLEWQADKHQTFAPTTDTRTHILMYMYLTSRSRQQTYARTYCIHTYACTEVTHAEIPDVLT